MFVSSDYLEIHYGVDREIARFFVDREPPPDNLYWKNKLLYLRPVPGYLFIPLYIDLLFKIGIDKQQLLSEQFVAIMEQILHNSALEEIKQITIRDAIQQSAVLVKNFCHGRDWYNNLIDYLNTGNDPFFSSLAVPFKALQRGDSFLFSICALLFSVELNKKIAEQWFALISILLIPDDAEDIEVDKKSGDQNAFIESGLTAEGFKKIEELAEKSIKKISSLNPAMANQLKKQYQEHVAKLNFL